MYRQSGTEKPDETSNTVAQNPRSRWVINMSKIPLTEAQENLLAHGPNFVITPRMSTHRRVYCSSRANMPKIGPWGS